MNFCSQCGHNVELRIPEGDNRPRYICSDCNTIHYQNPKIVTGTLPIWNDQVLLCKRAIEPRYGFWTLPAGFMENGETLEQAANRESTEEANANLDNIQLYTMVSLPHINQIYVMYLARLIDLDFSPGEESLEVSLFMEKDIPWDSLAFRTIDFTLKRFFEDRKKDSFPIHTHTIEENNRYKKN
jgi:ADP-ribose pyrophosphatase YjhB (NUDIX family)